VDDVIEHARRRADRPLELLPVDIPAARGIASHMPREINRPQVAGLVRQERLFTAWVRRLHVRDVRSWLAAVVLINEEQAGLPVLPGLKRNLVEDLARIELPGDLIVPRIHEVVLSP